MGLQFALTMITIMVRLYIAADNYAKKNGRLAADAIQPRACQNVLVVLVNTNYSCFKMF